MEGKQKASLTFTIQQNGVFVRRETLTQDVIKIGRDGKSHVCLADERVSRMHAVIEVASPSEVTIIDLGNEPGTLVNGARVAKARLALGDIVTVGSTTMVLEAIEVVAMAGRAAPRTPVPSFTTSAPTAFDPFAYNNPFASSATDPDAVPEGAPEGSYTYALLKNGPDVAPEECETQASSVEVMITWGANVLHVAHLTPPRSFYVGEEESKNLACDYFLPSETIGATRAPLVREDKGTVSVVVLPGATGSITLAGQPKTSFADAFARGLAKPCAELAGAHEIALPPGSKARMELAGMIFDVSTVNAGRAVSRLVIDPRALPYTGLSFLAHAAILGAMAYFMPPLGLTDGGEVSTDQQYMLQTALNDASAMKELTEREDPNVADTGSKDTQGGTGARAMGEEGSMGSTVSKATGKHYAIQGDPNNPDVHVARNAALRDAATFGMIGLINAGSGGDPNAVTAPWGGDDSSGKDAMSALGNMWGNELGESGGAGGLGLTGIGLGGGGKFEGIGLGSVGTIGSGSGLGDGDGFGPNRLGRGRGIGGGGRPSHAPIMRPSTTTVSGHIPPEVIQRIVRQNFGRFRLCYENGLRNNPNLAGRVAVRFVIGRDGAVSNVGNGGSDLPDSGVVSCVVRAFYGLSFPQPDEGIVTVVYPIAFSPG